LIAAALIFRGMNAVTASCSCAVRWAAVTLSAAPWW
jgi:hypothetical protein